MRWIISKGAKAALPCHRRPLLHCRILGLSSSPAQSQPHQYQHIGFAYHVFLAAKKK